MRLQTALADAIAGVVLVRHLLSHPIRYRGAAVGYPIYWAGDILVLYAALRAFGVRPDLIPLVLAYATSFVALLVQPSIRELHARLPRVPHTHPDRDEGFPFRPGEEAAS